MKKDKLVLLENVLGILFILLYVYVAIKLRISMGNSSGETAKNILTLLVEISRGFLALLYFAAIMISVIQILNVVIINFFRDKNRTIYIIFEVFFMVLCFIVNYFTLKTVFDGGSSMETRIISLLSLIIGIAYSVVSIINIIKNKTSQELC